MVLVRPTVLMAAIGGGVFPRRSELALYGMQIVSRGGVVWAEKAAWFRNVPVTAVYPTLGQMEIRVAFGSIASKAKGEKGLKTVTNPASKAYGKQLPPAAARVANEMPGRKAPHALAPEEYPSKLRHTLHTVKELEEFLRRRGVTVPSV
jgi:hypothetical protein